MRLQHAYTHELVPVEFRATLHPLGQRELLRGLRVEFWVKQVGREADQHVVALQILQTHLQLPV